MALNKGSVAPRMTEVPSDIVATLTPEDSDGKRDLLVYSADKYGTVKVRAYIPEGVNVKALNGHVLDFNVDGTQAEQGDDNSRRKELVARSVLIFTKTGKFSEYGNMTDDDFALTVLVVVNIPNWASVDTVTLKT